jgi:hypothetical protein
MYMYFMRLLKRNTSGARSTCGPHHSRQSIASSAFFFLLRLFRVMYFVLVFDEGLRAVNFSIMKNPTASVGSEPAILGSRGQHANP